MPWKQTAETEPCEMGSCPILFRAGGGGGRASSGPFIFLQSLLYHVLNRKCTEVGEKRRCLQIICVSVLASPCPLGISLLSVPLWWGNPSPTHLGQAELVSPDHRWPFLEGQETLSLGTATLSSPLLHGWLACS